MAGTYVAKAAVVKVAIGPADGNRVARIIRAGGVIPEGVDPASLQALAKRGLIERVQTQTTVPDPAAAEAAAAARATEQQEAAEKAAAAAAAASGKVATAREADLADKTKTATAKATVK